MAKKDKKGKTIKIYLSPETIDCYGIKEIKVIGPDNHEIIKKVEANPEALKITVKTVKSDHISGSQTKYPTVKKIAEIGNTVKAVTEVGNAITCLSLKKK